MGLRLHHRKLILSAVAALLLFAANIPHVSAQKKNESFRLRIAKATGGIVVDGFGNDSAWTACDVARDFFMVLPMDTSRANVKTEVRMTYDDRNIYLLATCFLPARGAHYYVESLRRDFAFGKNDNFLLFMDPFDDQTNGFSFGANAAGAQWDGTMFNGGDVDLNWDNKWRSEVTYDEEKWTLEMAIPFTTIRYKKNITSWGINFSRLDLATTEKSSWTPIPRQFATASLAYTGSLEWDAPPPSPGINVSVIPYVLGGVFKNHETGEDLEYRKKAGADVKLGITSSLNLDLTVNPDFSQVEVDRQVTNLDRFELFFPERRQFFLENGDLFGNFGYPTIRPFFSRRIGLGVPIRAGARLSGKINRNWRIGAMDIHTAAQKETLLPEQNFAIVSLQRRVLARSNVGFIYINKESINYTRPEDPTLPAYERYNRNLGMEFNLASSDNHWTGKTFFIKSFSPGAPNRDITQAGHIQYRSRKWDLLLQEEYVGAGVRAEVGYIPRNGYMRINPIAGRLFFPRGTFILSHGPKINISYYFDESLNRTDNLNMFFYTINARSQAVFTLALVDEYVKLLQPFDPTNTGREPLPAGTRHHWRAWRTEFISKPQSRFRYSFNTRWGTYYANGKRLNLTGEAGYRFQPFASFLVNASYNKIDLPAPWNTTTFWLVAGNLDLTLTNTIFFSTFVQYNEQTKNINLNSRFQWRFRPASDFFVVYTDNYLPDPFLKTRNRALVVKLTYWWNRR